MASKNAATKKSAKSASKKLTVKAAKKPAAKSSARRPASKVIVKASSKKTASRVKPDMMSAEKLRASLAGEIAKLKGVVGGPFGGSHSNPIDLKNSEKPRKLADLELVRRLARAVYSRADKIRQSIWNEVTQHRSEEELLGQSSGEISGDLQENASPEKV